MFIAFGIYNLGWQQHLLQYCYNYKGIYIKNMNKTWRYGNCNKKEGLQYHLFYITIAGINCYLPISNSMQALKSAALGSAICKMIRPSTSKVETILFPSIKNAVIGRKICKRSGLGVVYMQPLSIIMVPYRHSIDKCFVLFFPYAYKSIV